jgi:hypothetical protein
MWTNDEHQACSPPTADAALFPGVRAGEADLTFATLSPQCCDANAKSKAPLAINHLASDPSTPPFVNTPPEGEANVGAGPLEGPQDE